MTIGNNGKLKREFIKGINISKIPVQSCVGCRRFQPSGNGTNNLPRGRIELNYYLCQTIEEGIIAYFRKGRKSADEEGTEELKPD